MMRPLVFQVAPLGPRDLTAVFTTTHAVQLRWVNNATIPAATMYRVERANDSGFTTGIRYFIINGATVTSYLDTTANGVAYHYRVRAENAAAYSPWAPAVIPGAIPAAPTSLRISGTAITIRNLANVSIAWVNHPVTGVTVAGIHVFYSLIGPGGPWTLWATLPATASTYTFLNLSRGVTYWFRVEAFNVHGASTSNTVSGRF